MSQALQLQSQLQQRSVCSAAAIFDQVLRLHTVYFRGTYNEL
jgi:hypothetical protein